MRESQIFSSLFAGFEFPVSSFRFLILSSPQLVDPLDRRWV